MVKIKCKLEQQSNQPRILGATWDLSWIWAPSQYHPGYICVCGEAEKSQRDMLPYIVTEWDKIIQPDYSSITCPNQDYLTFDFIIILTCGVLRLKKHICDL